MSERPSLWPEGATFTEAFCEGLMEVRHSHGRFSPMLHFLTPLGKAYVRLHSRR